MNYRKSIFGSAIAFIIATSCCWLPAVLLGLGAGSTLVGFSNGLEKYSGVFITVGLGLLLFAGYEYYKSRKRPVREEAILKSVIECPECGHTKTEWMPTNACQYFYECENCHVVLKPKMGDCCVYCSYGSVKCPPVQLDQACC